VTTAQRHILPGITAATAALILAVAIILLLPGEPCLEWQGWRYVKIWPRPEHCPMMGVE
jgi:hypothetical protein